ncbi:MAG: hypothetical protein COY53_10020 [Elusimicrobia bacterium CG_4_10_14_0_8_um_filter_37_32]|nr:MAG: hypothetical protein COY53_10020 [Elusimicrobia bacterium CG_4_10_14_0_8_um_filter_37_32]
MGSKIKLSFFISLFLFIIPLSACAVKTTEQTKLLMGTYVQIKVRNTGASNAKIAIDKSFDEIERISKLMSRFSKDSEVYKINSLSPIQFLKINPELYSLIETSIKYSRLTDGAFDITIFPLVQLWQSAFKKNQIPDKNKVKNISSLVNYQNIILKNNTIAFKKENMGIDLGGIAKGYAVDCAINKLQECNIKEALVNAGGNIRVIGYKSWQIGLKHPRSNEILSRIELKNKSTATSGDYERYFVKEGTRYHHILNPKTGYSADECISVTIIGDTGIICDILSTAVFVLGPEKGMQIIENTSGLDAIIIDRDGNITISSGLKNKINLPKRIDTAVSS